MGRLFEDVEGTKVKINGKDLIFIKHQRDYQGDYFLFREPDTDHLISYPEYDAKSLTQIYNELKNARASTIMKNEVY